MAVLRLLLVRHGESNANVAAAQAEASGLEVIAAPARDADVALSPLGEQQAAALGRWLASNIPPGETSVFSSPYFRARETIDIGLRDAGFMPDIAVDERVRDRELGILDLLTTRGVLAKYPLEAQRKAWLGKFYYRPPGGESWADVALRVRAFLTDLDAAPAPETALVATHDAVVMNFLYVCLRWSEPELLEFARGHMVTNASVTTLSRDAVGSPWQLDEFAYEDHLHETNVPVTAHTGDETGTRPERLDV